MNIVIDTLRFSDKLKEAGFAERQADGLTRALSGGVVGTTCYQSRYQGPQR